MQQSGCERWSSAPDRAIRLPWRSVSTDPSPDPTPTAEEVAAARHDRKLANVLYHDWEAASYDEKWSISYDERCITYAADRFRHAGGRRPVALRPALELGCGTGFFLLNLMQAGWPSAGSVTDLSPGMVRGRAAQRRAPRPRRRRPGRRRRADPVRRRHVRPRRRARGAAPHPGRRRGASRGAAGAQAGRPVRVRGRADADRRPLRAPARRRSPGRPPRRSPGCPRCRAGGGRRTELDESSRAAALEAVVDIHTFDPAELEALARGAGAADVRVVTEEFTAAMLGWPVRTFEAAVPPGKLGMRLGDVRLPQLAAAVLAGRATCWPGWCRAPGSTTRWSPAPEARVVLLIRRAGRHRRGLASCERIRRSADVERPLEPLWRGLLSTGC